MGRVRCRSRWICREGGRWEVGGMFDDDDDDDDNAFIGWCFKSGNGLLNIAQ